MNALAIVNRHAPIKADNDDERLSDLGLDCIDRMTIALEIEDDHGVVVSDREVEAWQYVSCVQRCLDRVKKLQ